MLTRKIWIYFVGVCNRTKLIIEKLDVNIIVIIIIRYHIEIKVNNFKNEFSFQEMSSLNSYCRL